MIITLWCIAVVLISIVAIGTPLCWFLHGRRPLGEQEWIEAPFLGIAAIILVLQNLVYLDLPLRYTAALVWLAALTGWVLIYRARQIGASFATVPLAVFGTALGVYLVQGIGLLILGARAYMGRAWGDQFNYTVLAEFLADQPFSTPMREIGNRPYLVNAIAVKSDRIGQSILHSFFAISSLQEAKTLFEPTIVLAPALIVLAIYALGRRFGLQRGYALAAAATAGLLPAVAAIHLESFLSQALAVPLLLFCPILLDRLIEQTNWRLLCLCAILVAATISIYTEFWVVLLGLIALTLGVAALRPPHTWRLLSYGCGLVLAPFVLNPIFAPEILKIFIRVDEPVLGHIYPWALTIEGLSRIWLGDLVSAPAPFQSTIRLYGLAVTMLGYYGLMNTSLIRLSAGREIWRDYDQRRTLAFVLGVLALGLLPIIVLARDSEHPYQFYKLLLSMSPLLVLGLALAFQPHVFSPATPAAAPRPALPVLLLIGIILVASIVGTTNMALQSTSPQPAERYTGYYLIARDTQQLQERLEALRDGKLFIYQTDTTWDTGFLNAWLTYFARHNQIWLGNPHLNGTDLNTVPEARPILDLTTLPADILVLSNVYSEATSLVTTAPLWSNGSYYLWRPATRYWVVPLKLENNNGVERLAGETFFWMGRGDTLIEILASKAGTLSLSATFTIGPSAPELADRRVLVTTDRGYQQTYTLRNGIQRIVLPIEAGTTTITLQALDRPTVLRRPNGDTRPLLLGVQGLHVDLQQ